MSEMVERVARALMYQAGVAFPAGRRLLWEELDEHHMAAFRADARAAIAAMRDLPDDILGAGCAANPLTPYGLATTLREIVLAEHHAIIDAILNERQP